MYRNISGKKLHYRIKGQGKPIIFVHGWGGTIKSLEKLATLASKKYQALNLDLPGFGKSENPDPDWGIKEYAAVIRQLLIELKIEKINYFGHSFGGSLGIYLAINNPEIINKLILCDSSYKRRIPSSKSTRLAKSFFVLISQIPLISQISPILRKLAYKTFYPGSDLLKYPQLESNFKKIVSYDLTSCLDQIKTETLILWGENDKETPVKLAYELHQIIKNSKLKIFPGITHGLPLKYPDLVYGEIENFIC